MKGLILSIIFLGLLVLSTMLLSHLLRPKQYLRLFVILFFPWALLYAVAHWMTPQNLYFLPDAWVTRHRGWDMAYGLVILVLNFHSYIDFFFAFNGGFSMSLMQAILRSGDRGLTTEELVKGFMSENSADTIYAVRLPRLEKMGFIRIDQESGALHVTPKGLVMGRMVQWAKRLLNLGAGG